MITLAWGQHAAQDDEEGRGCAVVESTGCFLVVVQDEESVPLGELSCKLIVTILYRETLVKPLTMY